HEIIREHSMEAAKQVKMEGKPNDLVERIVNDDKFPIDKAKLQEVLDPANFIGFAPQQTEDFIAEHAQPILDKYQDLIGMNFELKV
ncbi:adenylosuccinate lyase, partial [Ornithobacterium rhinotracheale]|nr:adenylosuccinate lyase [Ornithobacterium rhinotracheale]